MQKSMKNDGDFQAFIKQISEEIEEFQDNLDRSDNYNEAIDRFEYMTSEIEAIILSYKIDGIIL